MMASGRYDTMRLEELARELVDRAVTLLALALAEEHTGRPDVYEDDLVAALRLPVSAAAIVADLARILDIPAPALVRAAMTEV